MRNRAYRLRLAALCLWPAVLPACASEHQEAAVNAIAQSLSLAADDDEDDFFRRMDADPLLKPTPCAEPTTNPETSTLENFPDGSGTGGGDDETLEQYTADCEAAVGFVFPEELSCEVGEPVPGQDVTCDAQNVLGCDRPNVLNQHCDPGSRFQRLPLKPTDKSDAAVVMHCRKQNRKDGYYGDIAIIMSNSTTGATCFFQALGTWDGRKIPSPKRGQRVEGFDFEWYSPLQTSNTGCTSCHDNGPFVRSPYLTQLTKEPHVLPNLGEGFSNDGRVPSRWVGKSFSDKHSYSVKLANPPCINDDGQGCLTCTTCHTLAVNDYTPASVPFNKYIGGYFAPGRGSALDLGIRATAPYQASKHAHSEQSPIWMTPHKTAFDKRAHDAALKFAECGAEFINKGYDKTALSPGCSVEDLGGPWVPPTQPPAAAAEPLPPTP